jgi:hypothetical protein
VHLGLALNAIDSCQTFVRLSLVARGFRQEQRLLPTVESSRVVAEYPAPHLQGACLVDHAVTDQSGQRKVERVTSGA